jgi:hypothetical protein
MPRPAFTFSAVPGGSPLPVDTDWVPVEDLLRVTMRRTDSGELVPVYGGRCAAAARQAFRGKQYSDTDREEAAVSVLAAVLLKAADHFTPRHGSPAAVLRWIGWAERHGAALADVEIVPADVCRFSFLYQTACSRRRTIDRDRERDAAAALDRAADGEGFRPMRLPGESEEVRRTPWGARSCAVDMLRSLGMLGTAVDAGPVWSTAYAAARAAAGLESAEIADELEISPATLRQHLSRCAGRIPSVSYGTSYGHAAALGMVDATRPARKGDARHAADIGERAHGWRDAPDAAAPVAIREGESRPAPAPDWAADLPAATRARLDNAVRVKREARANRTPDDLAAVNALREERGLPALAA